ncbi:MAG: hypothetical protein BGO49_05785 [Planctomycetales bacterium 71-10]|nr:MAG: hypothetical protein BGO49_05785 [Planctomycetales bacterium 71-10]
MAKLTAIVAAMLATSAAADEGLPRYRLEPGMVLTYKGSGRSQYTEMTAATEGEMTAWVVGRSPDGSVKVVMRQGSRYASARDGKEPELGREPLEYEFGRFDLFPDGRLGSEGEIGHRIRPQTIFPRLPDDRGRAEAGWSSPSPDGFGTSRYEGLQAEPGGWSFRSQSEGPENRVYESTSSKTIHFDANRGVVKRTDEEQTQGYGFQGKGTGTSELTSVEVLDSDKLAAFVRGAEAYFAADKAVKDSYRSEDQDPAKLESALATAKAELVKARDAMSEGTFREALDRRIEGFDSSIRYSLDDAKRRAAVIGKPAASWKAPGLDGKAHDLADYRGKVVVLDFWYRGCGWCVRAMPQMNEVTEHFAGKPVAVLGMNTDGDAGDAKLVVDVMGLKYDTIRIHDDRELPGKYGVQGFPTVIVIDPEGIVRDVHVGYSKDLREKLTKSIEALLPK